MNKKTNNKRRILQVFCLLIIIIGLFVSIAFSTLNVSSKTLFNSRYSGGYQALVEVYDEKNTSESGSASLPNGDATKAAGSLQTKLSPFSDNTVDIKVIGKHRLTVTSTKEQYQNNTTAFKNAIEQDGGLLALNTNFNDILFDDTTMEKVTGAKVFENNNLKTKTAISDIFGTVRYTADKNGSAQQQNSPFLIFEEGKKEGYLDKLAAPVKDEESQQSTNQSLTLVSSMQNILNNLREYYALAPNEKELDSYLLAYYHGVIEPFQAVAYKTGQDTTITAVLDDLFSVNYQVKHNNTVTTKKASLLGNKLDFWWEDNNSNHQIGGTDAEVLKQLKALLYGNFDDNNNIGDYQIEFINPVSKYVIDSNATTDDFVKEGGKYKESFKFSLDPTSSLDIKVYKAADIITQTALKDVLFINKKEDGSFNQNLRNDVFANNFIMINDEIAYTPSLTTETPSTYAYAPSAKFSQSKNYLSVETKSATIAKTIEASIIQTTSGFSFKVVKINEFSPDVTFYMLLASLISLLILAILAIVYLLFAYRLLGLYTLIIAVTAVMITLLAPTLFSIAIGVETLTLVFIVLAIVLDCCVIFIESFKYHLNNEKRSQIESFKLANKENASSIFDLILLVSLPNIILFWISSGSLKNLATLAVVSTASLLVLVVVIFRLMFWLSIKADLFRKNPLLLPLDTSILHNRSAIFDKLKLARLEYKLKVLTNKAKVSSKDLLKIKHTDDQIKQLQKIIDQKEQLFATKQVELHAKKLTKLESTLAKLQAKQSGKKNAFLHPILWVKKQRIDTLATKKAYSQTLVNQAEKNTIKIAKDAKDTKIIFNINKVLIMITLIFSIVGAILAFTIGPKYSNSFGRDNTFIIYGKYVADFADTRYENVEEEIRAVDEAKADELHDKVAELNKPGSDATENERNMYAADVSAITIQYIYENNLVDLFSGTSKAKGQSNLIITWGNDYLVDDIEGTRQTAWVRIDLSNKTSFKQNRSTLKGILTGSSVWTGNENDNANAILGMNQIPFTAYGQIKQILIGLAILLLALVVYIMIRFKWTYYVALALGIIVVGAITTSLVIMFRVPISYELLSTFVVIIAFAIMAIILVLGRTRSLVQAKTRAELEYLFTDEITIRSHMHTNVLAKRRKISELKKIGQAKINKLKLDKVSLKIKKLTRFEKYNKFKACFVLKSNSEVKAISQAIKQTKKTNKLALKPILLEIKLLKKTAKLDFNKTIKQNEFMKSVFNETMNFGIRKMLLIGMFYLFFALILIVTIPAIVGVGMTLLIGIIITNVFVLTAAIPMTVYFEKRRIAAKFGYRDFIKQTDISQEEQIVKDIND